MITPMIPRWRFYPLRIPNEGNTPHPVPLPMGEGTLGLSLRVVKGSLLPWGEGQDEGRFARYVGEPRPGFRRVSQVAA